MVAACVQAVVNGSTDVLVAFPYVLKLPKDFPRGILERQEGNSNIRRIKVSKLLAWLNEKGHTDVTMELLRVQQANFTKALNALEKELFGEEPNDVE